MRLAMLVALALTLCPLVTAANVSIEFRSNLSDTGPGVYRDAILVRNHDYPDVDVVNTTVTSQTVTANETTTWKTNLTVSSYTYSDTTLFNVTNETDKVCASMTPPQSNKTTNTTRICQHIHDATDPTADEAVNATNTTNHTSDGDASTENKTGLNESTETSSTANQTTPADDTSSAEANQTRSCTQQNNTDTSPTSDDDTPCENLIEAPSTIKAEQTITFSIQTNNAETTYWATSPDGSVIKDKYTTTNAGEKQFTPDSEAWVNLHAATPQCNTTRSVGVAAEDRAVSTTIDDVSLGDTFLTADITSYDDEKSSLVILADTGEDERVLTEVDLPAGEHSVEASIPVASLGDKTTTIQATRSGSADTYKVEPPSQSVQNEYPRFITSVYHRKELFGPTTLYVSFADDITGELRASIGNRTTTQNLTASSSAEITVIPDAADDIIGLTVTDRVGDVVDRAYHEVSLEREGTETRPSPSAENTRATDYSSTNASTTEPQEARTAEEADDASAATSNQSLAPPSPVDEDGETSVNTAVGAALLTVGAGYGVLRLNN